MNHEDKVKLQGKRADEVRDLVLLALTSGCNVSVSVSARTETMSGNIYYIDKRKDR